MIKHKYSKEQQEVINKHLITIVQAKDDICEYAKNNGLGCSDCILSVDDKCSALNLPEYNFEVNAWNEEINDTVYKR